MPKRRRKSAAETQREREIWAYWGQMIRQAREARGWQVQELAQRVGMQPSRLSMLETGQSGTGLDKMERLADALSLDLARFPGHDASRATRIFELLQVSDADIQESIVHLLERLVERRLPSAC